MAEFVTVAKTSDFADGDRIVIQVKRDWIVIFKVSGRFYAVEDMCTHEDEPLSDGYLDGMEIECAKHGARFDIETGKVLAPPAYSNVKIYPTRIVGDDLQVEL